MSAELKIRKLRRQGRRHRELDSPASVCLRWSGRSGLSEDVINVHVGAEIKLKEGELQARYRSRWIQEAWEARDDAASRYSRARRWVNMGR